MFPGSRGFARSSIHCASCGGDAGPVRVTRFSVGGGVLSTDADAIRWTSFGGSVAVARSPSSNPLNVAGMASVSREIDNPVALSMRSWISTRSKLDPPARTSTGSSSCETPKSWSQSAARWPSAFMLEEPSSFDSYLGSFIGTGSSHRGFFAGSPTSKKCHRVSFHLGSRDTPQRAPVKQHHHRLPACHPILFFASSTSTLRSPTHHCECFSISSRAARFAPRS